MILVHVFHLFIPSLSLLPSLPQNERVVVFLDDQELLHSSYIPLVYEFVKDCSITIDFTPEERSRIVNSLRSEVTKNGSDYTEQKAWNFFIW